MRFGLVHRIMTDALAALGILAVVSTASLSPWTSAFLVVSLAACLAIPEGWAASAATPAARDRRDVILRRLGSVGPILLCLVQGTRIFLLGHPPLEVTVEFAALLQIIRLATRRGAAHDQQIIILALLHFVAGTVLGGGLSYALCLIGFLLVAPGALVLSHLRREVEGNYRQGARDRTGLPVDVPRILRSRRVVGKNFLLVTCLLSVPILCFTATLFVFFPRVGLSLLLLTHPRSGRMVGFSDHVDLGQVGVLRADPSIALRFDLGPAQQPPPPRMTLRFRGTAFDHYDGKAWDRTTRDRGIPVPRAGTETDTYPIPFPHPLDTSRTTRIAIDLEPIDPPVVFLPPHTVALHIHQPEPAMLNEAVSLLRGPEGEFRYEGGQTAGLRYEALVSPDGLPVPDMLRADARARYLTLPPAFPARIATLAHAWADREPSDDAKARALEGHLRAEFRYDMASPSGASAFPVDDFLFVSRRGHCEFFSTAMALMLRSVGIPSRNVTGFVGGTYNRFGHYYAVRQGDAHSWVEAYIADSTHPGWITYDPTPPAGAQPLEDTSGALVYLRDVFEALSQRWNAYIVGYDLRTQQRLFDDLARTYDAVRGRAGSSHRLPWARAGRISIAILVLAGALALASRQLRRRSPKPADDAASGPQNAAAQAATALYITLEAALTSRGVGRPTSRPPLRHALDLTERGHPLAPEVLALTCVYLEARFGHQPLGPDDVRSFQRRVRDVRDSPETECPGWRRGARPARREEGA